MIEQKLETLFKQWANEPIENIISISPSGSNRKYYRIYGTTKRAVGVINNERKENIAFINFTKHFFHEGLNVPEIYAENLNDNIYLLQDLGDKTLFSVVVKERTKGVFSTELTNLYKKAIDELIRFQVVAGRNINFSYCYPSTHFDEQSILWDLSYFKKYFLFQVKIPFNEKKLEEDFQNLSYFLTEHIHFEYFMYRDFQSRNIMLHNNKLYFIDFQGGRRGALQYDLASFLYQAKAQVPKQIREELLMYYLNSVSKIIPIKKKEFIQLYRGYVLIRMLQVLGTYGFRGLIEKKDHFIQSIPFAIKNIELFLKNYSLSVEIPELIGVLEKITQIDINKIQYGK